ncbi:hypothetical protein LI073_01790 [bacterium 210917-SL.2.15]|nr:hypothetical protein [bacterium 210917-SL.2.15]
MAKRSIHNLFKKEIQIGHHYLAALWYVIDALEKDQKNKNITFFSYLSFYETTPSAAAEWLCSAYGGGTKNSMSPERACLKAAPVGAALFILRASCPSLSEQGGAMGRGGLRPENPVRE